MTSNNIFQVTSFTDLEDIFEDHSLELIVVMFSMKTCEPCKKIKPVFVELAKSKQLNFFIYIDIENFQDSNGFLKGVVGVPRFSFYFNSQEIASFEGADSEALVKTLNELNEMIEARKSMIRQQYLQKLEQEKEKEKQQQIQQQQQVLQQQQVQQQVQQQQIQQIQQVHQQQAQQQQVHQQQVQQQMYQQTLQTPQFQIQQPVSSKQQKMLMLKKLYELTKQGVELSMQYTLESSLDDMEWEYNIHTNPSQIVVGGTESTISSKNELEIEKQKKINEIHEMSNLNKMIQAKKLYQLQQLKHLQKMKEQKESVERNQE